MDRCPTGKCGCVLPAWKWSLNTATHVRGEISDVRGGECFVGSLKVPREDAFWSCCQRKSLQSAAACANTTMLFVPGSVWKKTAQPAALRLQVTSWCLRQWNGAAAYSQRMWRANETSGPYFWHANYINIGSQTSSTKREPICVRSPQLNHGHNERAFIHLHAHSESFTDMWNESRISRKWLICICFTSGIDFQMNFLYCVSVDFILKICSNRKKLLFFVINLSWFCLFLLIFKVQVLINSLLLVD